MKSFFYKYILQYLLQNTKSQICKYFYHIYVKCTITHYSAGMNGKVSYYHDRYGLEADAVLHLKDGRYALTEFKLGSKEIDMGARHLCEIERLIANHNKKEKQVPLRLPDLKLIITATEYGYMREDGVYVIPIGCLKN